ncbi:hypothetical protein RsS62_51740 [Rhizobium dioscoreae]|uniref:DUF488 domain-containing protein n=1 Tax=Rhizobium dioscoreae TaxID=2653122 RepID=UPI00128696DD|nr:DUF488 family protein [Rhizobium dioscoreae]GES45922.1 hypothetical protein RsS62_51740 [Rhizobium dioscoreae]
MIVRLKRVYDAPEVRDGERILVDRLWPRGLAKSDAKLDRWLKDVAPSSDLRKWFGHRADRWGEFADRYRRELADNEAFSELRRLAADRDLTLVYAAHDPKHNHALVLLSELVDALG